jgi:1-acyl-sn-glycerol-3-phosphate acyltransferase
MPSWREVFDPPSWPGSLERPAPRDRLGVNYETSWARRRAVRVARNAITDTLTKPITDLLTSPSVSGTKYLEAIEGPVIFAPNHTSHFDTAVTIAALPKRFRHRVVVAAAADYFFDRHWKAGLFAFLLGTVPVERARINRKSSDLAAELLEEGWSLIIYPEGGRSPDGWGQEFRGGAAYLSKRCNVPVVPVHLRGVRPVFPRNSAKFTPGKIEVRFGEPLRAQPSASRPGREEDARRFSRRIEEAVATLGDEAETDWWSAKKRAAAGLTPAFRGPDASPWRRSWALPASARRSHPREQDDERTPW